MRCNPCCCCSTEAGIYVLLFFNLLYIAALIVFSVGYSSWTLTTVIYEPTIYDRQIAQESGHHFIQTNTTEYKVLSLLVWLVFLVYFVLEVILGLYLLKAVNLGDMETCIKSRRWVKTRTILIVSIIPFVIFHAYLHYEVYGLVVISCTFLYHMYYIVVVLYYAHEIEVELNTARMCNSEKCRVCLTYSRASKRPLIIESSFKRARSIKV